jgi:DNA-binding NarL/FixJ family response regulator
MQLNSVLVHPLGYGEIKQISKSVGKFCWKNDAYAYHMFIERQSIRGKLSNSSPGGAARSASYDPLREQAAVLYADGMKKKDIAAELGVSDRTIRNWLNQ